MKRVLLVSTEPVGRVMAGPGIRYFNFARELVRRGYEVTLLVPNADATVDGVEVVSGPRTGHRIVLELARRADVVVAQHLEVPTMLTLARRGPKTVYDLYVPYVSENLAFAASQQPTRRARLGYRAADLVQGIALATGDGFLCASDRQRDLWLGRLSGLGRIGVDEYRADPSFAHLVAVVPFGLDPEPPAPGDAATFDPSVGEADRVVLWGGGVWNWFDPLTVIRAVAALAERRDDVRLLFMGLRHPSPAVAAMAMTDRAVALARGLGVEGTSVLFNFGWLPYAERAATLLRARIGVSAHFDTIETRYAFRTRLLDYLWAGLPTVATEGDVLGDLVASAGLGRTVRAGDLDGWVDALGVLLDDDDAHAEARRNIGRVRARFGWPRVVDGLVELIESDGSVRSSRAAWRLAAEYAAIQARVAARDPRLVLERLRPA